MRVLILSFVVISAALLLLRAPSAVGSALLIPDSQTMSSIEMLGENHFHDEFEDSTLDPAWNWIREAPDSWSLTERPGFLRLHTQQGTLDGAVLPPVLVRPAPSLPYDLTARIEFSPTVNYQEAAILVYDDDDNYVKLSRLYNSEIGGSAYLLVREVAGTRSGAVFAAAAGNSVELRMSVAEDVITGWYNEDESGWVTLGTISTAELEALPWVGLTAHNGQSADSPSTTVDYDVISTGAPDYQLFLPFVRR